MANFPVTEFVEESTPQEKAEWFTEKRWLSDREID